MKLNFCALCGSTLRKDSNTRYVCEQNHEIYNSPRAAASAVFIKNGKVLLGIRGQEPAKGKLSLPGGFLDYGEQPVDAIKREMHEELGITLTDHEVIAAYTNQYGPNTSTTVTVFLIHGWDGDMKPDDDLEDIVWKTPDVFTSNELAWPHPSVLDAIKPYISAQA